MIDRAKALASLPQGLQDELFDEYDDIVRNYREGRWKASGLDGGRFSEVAYNVLLGITTGTFPANANKPSNFKAKCDAFATDNQKYPPANSPHSARVLIPRILAVLYDVRNNRNVGHIGGDVPSNHMDAELVLHCSQWVMAEFVRIFHGLSVVNATATVAALVERTVPTIWEVGNKKRVLKTDLPLADKTLLLLYSTTGPVQDKVLADWLEQPRLDNYKRVLRALHKAKWVEYSTDGSVTLSPTGTGEVEDRLL
ncbi:hypothetical protein [Mycolicibacterium bacteremicum]|uniref:Uncharacterized protein n=1 Tax=Mycolicibacterium bacteremicum TaxID=564198 RepID=A0A1W9YQ00_MYCBA|nr:hypothetical protein [Mycolicibacterium bacteremicum]MCV7430844.1 hypothetical protein [Mycolicibacterium bacteremicum]ORA01992.1 hypothetical protein BST17_25620 [Mycolicibacterium bacteremicum]